MRPFWRLDARPVTTGCVLLAAVALTACSAHKATADANAVTATDASTAQRIDEARTLGAPSYPGALAGEPGVIVTQTAKGSSAITAFSTRDAFEKVFDFYKQRLPAGAEKIKVTTEKGSVASFQTGDERAPEILTVQISTDRPHVTTILITHLTKTGASPIPRARASAL